MKKIFTFCSQHCLNIAEGGDLMESTADAWNFCAVCGNYGQGYIRKEFDVDLVHKEECDCMKKYGRIKHCDGGNYHLTTYKLI